MSSPAAPLFSGWNCVACTCARCIITCEEVFTHLCVICKYKEGDLLTLIACYYRNISPTFLSHFSLPKPLLGCKSPSCTSQPHLINDPFVSVAIQFRHVSSSATAGGAPLRA